MDELSEHYFVAVGELLGQAFVGGLRVELRLADGTRVTGIPNLGRETSADELDETGHPQRIQVDGETVALAAVRSATLLHPGHGPA